MGAGPGDRVQRPPFPDSPRPRRRVVRRVSVSALVEGASGEVRGVALSDGRIVEADTVLVAIGSAPSVAWMASSGLDLTDGVRCDATCAVEGTWGVVAAGDVASWWNPLYQTNASRALDERDRARNVRGAKTSRRPRGGRILQRSVLLVGSTRDAPAEHRHDDRPRPSRCPS
ncbi:MAG: hypothetical protein EOO27_34250 [Comamonadaceae bacterium]|nr:MAG: hypothetical protein EOO27_34250 [Comamonadaceae bacterium]